MDPTIKIPREEFSRGPIEINLKDYLPGGKKENLLRLSDEELAQLTPEELEQVKTAQQNLLAIKKANKEVREMENEEQWKAVVEQYAKEHNFTIEEAAAHLQKEMSGDKLTSFFNMMRLFKPETSKDNPMVAAIEKAVAERFTNILDIAFPTPKAPGDQPRTSSGNQPNPIVAAINQAKDAGVQSIFLPDGTQLFLQGQNSDTLTAKIETTVTEHVKKVIGDSLPAILNPGRNRDGGGGDNTLALLDPELANLKGVSPELLKVYYDHKARALERQAADARSQGRDEAVVAGFSLLGALFSKEGFETARKTIMEAKEKAKALKTSPEEKPKAEAVKTTCWKCGKDFVYEVGQDPVCLTCHMDQRVKCPSCSTIFIPKSAEEMVCPKCYASLELPPEKEKEPGKEKPLVSEAPAAKVGTGLE